MNHTTRTFPRTLNQAFGPHTSHVIDDNESPSDGDITLSLIFGVIASLVLFGLWMGWLA